MDVNGSDMLNYDDFALFWTNGGVVGPRDGKLKNWRFCSYGNFGDKTTVFTCLLTNEVCDSFPKRLNLALAPKKQMKGLRSNETPGIMIICGTLSLV